MTALTPTLTASDRSAEAAGRLPADLHALTLSAAGYSEIAALYEAAIWRSNNMRAIAFYLNRWEHFTALAAKGA